MKGTLSVVKGGGALRTSTMTGECTEPTVGVSFFMVGEPLDPALEERHLQTSTVVLVEPRAGGYRFATKSGSVYDLVLSD